MNCNEIQSILDAYVDHELSLETSLSVERHLAGCAECSTIYENRRILRRAIQSSSLYKTAPTSLRNRIVASTLNSKSPGANHISTNIFVTAKLLRPIAAAASVVLVALVSWGIGHRTLSTLPTEGLPRELFASDVRSLMSPSRGIDILSSNQHTVKPWFAGKLDFSPPVQDFATKGYPLVGGRRDYINGRVVAALVYKRHQHWINLYIWPTDERAALTEESYQGYHLLHWDKNGMTYWAVSDLNVTELSYFASLIQSEN